MGSLRHLYEIGSSFHQQQSAVPSNKSSSKMSSNCSSSAITALAVQLKNVASSTTGHMVNSKAEQLGGGNESMDSGVAGLRDGTTTTTHNGSPASIVTHHHLHHGHHHHAVLPPLIDRMGCDDVVQQQYIVDRSTRTTYLKGKFLGKGGFARVHELTDLTTGHIYAGKIIPKSRITKPHHKEKIAREIELHRNLVHPHVVRFYHCFEDDENVYIILENCSKKSLVHVMKHRKTLTEPEVRFYLRQLADGLRYVHGNRIVHRDLKLGNMFLSENMTVKIGDFGLAARLHADSKVTICGTPNYIAPEVLSRQGHGYEADLWAMGCSMYAMLVGQPPFETSSLSETYSRIEHNMYVIPQWVSRSARSLIRQLLAPDPRHRPTLDQVLKHDFFTSGLMPASLPGSCCSKAPNFSSNDSGIKSDGDSTNENASPVTHHLRVPSVVGAVVAAGSAIGGGGGGRPESSSVKAHHHHHHHYSNNNSRDPQQRVSRSHSLKESAAARKEKKEQQNAGGMLPISLKQKITSVLCPERTAHDQVTSSRAASSSALAVSSPANTPSLCTALDSCLYVAAQACTNPCPVPVSPLFISKWIDYSNKYGFGFQLSDRSVGVLFNDSTRISYSGDRTRLDFQDSTGKTSSHSVNALPAYLMERLTLLRYFAQYMDENLTEGGDSSAAGSHHQPGAAAAAATANALTPRRIPPPSFVHMKRWVRTPKAIIMQLDNNTLQINFFKDHTKIVLSYSTEGQYLATYINSDRQSATYRLSDISSHGCEPTLRERLVYALTVLREFAELDGEKA